MNGIVQDIFGPGSHIQRRIIREYNELESIVNALRKLGLTIVATSGTYDLKHTGHDRYLEIAKSLGNVLVVGVDSDDKVRKRKGEGRPIVPENERMEALCHTRHVDLVFLKSVDDAHLQFIKAIHPDVFVTTQGEYEVEDLPELNGICGRVEVLERQAPVSTTARIRLVLLEPISKVKEKLGDVMNLLDELTTGGSHE